MGVSRVRWWVGIVAVVVAGVRADGAQWTLTTADFQTRQVELVGMNGDGVKVKGAEGEQVVKVGDLLELSRQGGDVGAVQKGGAFVLVMGSGDRLTGGPVGIQGESLTWSSPAVGQMAVGLKDVREIRKAVQSGQQQQGGGGEQQPPTEDTLTLGNGDVVKGIVTGMAEGKVTVQQQGGDAIPVPLDSVARMVFASSGGAKSQAAERGFRVRLTDGSVLTAAAVTIQGEKVSLKLRDGSGREVPLSGVAGVEQVNGPVVFLSSLAPVEDVQRPYLGDPWPTRLDRTVSGGPLAVGGKTYAHGLGVHSYSKVVYELNDPSYETFRTQYAIDGGGPFANVTVRVWADGKVAYEKANVTAASGVSPVVTVPVGGAKRIGLEVDYGQGNDTQDRFVWLEPAVVRKG